MPLKGFLTAKVCTVAFLNSLITICVRGVLGDLPWRRCDSVGSPAGTFLSNFVIYYWDPKVFRIFQACRQWERKLAIPSGTTIQWMWPISSFHSSRKVIWWKRWTRTAGVGAKAASWRFRKAGWRRMTGRCWTRRFWTPKSCSVETNVTERSFSKLGFDLLVTKLIVEMFFNLVVNCRPILAGTPCDTPGTSSATGPGQSSSQSIWGLWCNIPTALRPYCKGSRIRRCCGLWRNSSVFRWSRCSDLGPMGGIP